MRLIGADLQQPFRCAPGARDLLSSPTPHCDIIGPTTKAWSSCEESANWLTITDSAATLQTG